jgi:hypothetical protein
MNRPAPEKHLVHNSVETDIWWYYTLLLLPQSFTLLSGRWDSRLTYNVPIHDWTTFVLDYIHKG